MQTRISSDEISSLIGLNAELKNKQTNKQALSSSCILSWPVKNVNRKREDLAVLSVKLRSKFCLTESNF